MLSRLEKGRDELVLMLDHAVQSLHAQGYGWPMIGMVVLFPRIIAIPIPEHRKQVEAAFSAPTDGY